MSEAQKGQYEGSRGDGNVLNLNCIGFKNLQYNNSFARYYHWGICGKGYMESLYIISCVNLLLFESVVISKKEAITRNVLEQLHIYKDTNIT